MAADPIPEQVYLDAANTWAAMISSRSDGTGFVPHPPFRAAIEAVYRAARLATAREIADAANRPGSVPAASWRAAMDIIDELGGDPR